MVMVKELRSCLMFMFYVLRNVGHNGFNGSLPAIGDVQKLFLLALSSNDFSGPIPAGFGSLNELNRL